MGDKSGFNRVESRARPWASEALSPSPDLEDGAERSGSNGYRAKVAASKQLMRGGKVGYDMYLREEEVAIAGAPVDESSGSWRCRRGLCLAIS
jgi:hypothetical protein